MTEYYTTSQWKRFILFFCRRKSHTEDGVQIVFKMLRGIMYIIAIHRVPPRHINCRCISIPQKESE